MKSPYRFETGEDVFALYQHADYEVMHFTEVVDFYLWPDRIVCQLLDPAYAYCVEIYFLGSVLSYWLERRGVLMLHASSVVIGNNAVGFLASKHGGKSSLAVAMAKSGYPMLTDDLLPVKLEGEKFLAFPGFPRVRLWPDQVQAFWGPYEDLDLVHPAETKRWVPVGKDGLGSFCDSPRELKRLYVLERRAEGTSECHIQSGPLSEALMEIVRNSFIPNLLAKAGLQPARLRVMAELTRRVPVKTLVYPSGFEHFRQVAAAIEDDLSR